MKRQRIGIVFLLVFAWGGLMGCGQELIKEGKDYKQQIEQAIWSKDGTQIVFLYSHLFLSSTWENSNNHALTKYIYTLDVEKRKLKQITSFNNRRSGSTLALLDWVANKKFLISMDTPESQEKMYEVDMNGQRSDTFPAQIQDTTTGNNQAYYTDDLKSIILLIKNPWYGNTGKTENSLIQLHNIVEKTFRNLTLDFPAEIERPILIDSMSVFSTDQKTRVCISVEGIKTKDKSERIIYQMYFDLVNQQASNLQVYKKYSVTNDQRIVFSFMGWKSVDEVVYALGSEDKPLYFSHNLVTNKLESLNFPAVGQLNTDQSKLMIFKGVNGLLVIDVKNPINQVFINYDQLPRGDFIPVA